MPRGRPLIAGILAAALWSTGGCTGGHHRDTSSTTTAQIPAGGGTVTWLIRSRPTAAVTDPGSGPTTSAFTLTAHGVGPLTFGSSGSSAETVLKAAFGPAAKTSDGPSCDLGGGDPGRQRLLTWGNLTIALDGQHRYGAGLKLTSWLVSGGRITAPVKLPHGLVPGDTYGDLIANAPGAHAEDWIGGETEMLDANGVQYLFDLHPSGGSPISTIAAGVIPCD